MTKIAEAAQALLDRRLNLIAGPRFDAYLRPRDNAEAFAIQTEVSRLLLASHHDDVGGWKCLLPSEGKLVVGPIYHSTIHSRSPCPALALNGSAVIEPEFAFIMGETLSPGDTAYTDAEVLAALGATRLALELIKSRYAEPKSCEFPELLADGLFNQGLFLGSEIGSPAPASLKLSLSVDERTQQLTGQHPNGDALAPLLWLANFLRQQGIPLRKGQAVITGSYAGVLEVPFGRQVEVVFEDLGAIRVEFTEMKDQCR